MSDPMTTITADELLERADVCAFRDTALALLRADASPWQLRTALNVAVSVRRPSITCLISLASSSPRGFGS